ncbi:hypothetical protein NicSoilB8_17440 [Arthrobacter sp. NicSoilB8]|nr:hypothetical protein NicSoilB8_17440 [Arthrobacter sp. NicSoilB8]
MVTTRGIARAAIVPESFSVPSDFGRAGLGIPTKSKGLPESWSTALTALQLASEDEPVVDAIGLGSILALAEAAASMEAPPDVAALAKLDAEALKLLDILAETASVRGTAIKLGRHHSTVQDRINSIAGKLGYDPRTSKGRTRFTIARSLLALSRPIGS